MAKLFANSGDPDQTPHVGTFGLGLYRLPITYLNVSRLKGRAVWGGSLLSMFSYPASILRKSTSDRHRPVSYPDGPMTARYRFT